MESRINETLYDQDRIGFGGHRGFGIPYYNHLRVRRYQSNQIEEPVE
ncbi:MAG TPA: hypothetical protein VJS17_05060 [Pyrinomonadaceae bacterium]|nr:hypothetical protein [Pyrinomonadaceae bacterium]